MYFKGKNQRTIYHGSILFLFQKVYTSEACGTIAYFSFKWSKNNVDFWDHGMKIK